MATPKPLTPPQAVCMTVFPGDFRLSRLTVGLILTDLPRLGSNMG